VFTQYVALGDSMSIDLYPALDAGETDVAVALEWDAAAGQVAPLGAASLLHRNVDERHPEFAGNDLVSRWPDVAASNLAEDGATIGDVFGTQLTQLGESEEPTLITISVGGNDLLSAFANRPVPALLARIVVDVAEGYEFLLQSIRRARPRSSIILTTIYDPSDGTKKVPGLFDGSGPLPIQSLHALNGHIADMAKKTTDGALADVHAHFLGHGVTATARDRWYWKRSWIEPNAAGASEIRRVWLGAVEKLLKGRGR
jgi:lysophospholipase L1-like esterase